MPFAISANLPSRVTCVLRPEKRSRYAVVEENGCVLRRTCFVPPARRERVFCQQFCAARLLFVCLSVSMNTTPSEPLLAEEILVIAPFRPPIATSGSGACAQYQLWFSCYSILSRVGLYCYINTLQLVDFSTLQLLIVRFPFCLT